MITNAPVHSHMKNQDFIEYYVIKNGKFYFKNNNAYSNYKRHQRVYIIVHFQTWTCVKYIYNMSFYHSGLQKNMLCPKKVMPQCVLSIGMHRIFSKVFKNYVVWCIS